MTKRIYILKHIVSNAYKGGEKSMEAKLNFNDLLTIGLTLGVTAIGMSYVADVIADVQSGQASTTKAYNISRDGLSGVGTLAGKLPTIATVLAAAIIIGVLINNFMFNRG